MARNQQSIGSTKWYNLAEISIEDIKSRLDESKYYILKPTEGCLGEGIRKIKGAEFWEPLFDTTNIWDYILEECVVNISEIAAFHHLPDMDVMQSPLKICIREQLN